MVFSMIAMVESLAVSVESLEELSLESDSKEEVEEDKVEIKGFLISGVFFLLGMLIFTELELSFLAIFMGFSEQELSSEEEEEELELGGLSGLRSFLFSDRGRAAGAGKGICGTSAAKEDFFLITL